MPKIPNKPEEIFQEIIADYKNIFGADLVSIILYGSGARGEYVHKKSDINFLITLTEAGIDTISKAFKSIARWHKARVSTPLFLTKSHIVSSLDVFPIEFLNFKSFYMVVYGEDVLKDLIIDKKHLRLQCERELKGKLLQLRHQFLETGGNRADIERLISRSVSTFHSIFQAVLFLYGEPVFRGSRELVSLMGHKTGLDITLFLELLTIKEGTRKLSSGEAVSVMEGYIEQIKNLAAFLNEIQIREGQIS
jgi:predicted nucleotidyltransferase